MSRVTQDTTPNLPTPELRAFADRTLQELKLAFSKALAHEADRQSIPMPAAADATENRALAAIRTLPRSLKKRIVAGYTTRDAQARRDDLGAFADVPLDQDESLSAALHRGHPSGLGTLDLFGETTLAMWSVPDDSTKEHRKLRMVLEALECVEATTGAGDDDMALGAITNSAAGHTKKIGPEFVAALQSGQTHHFSGSAAELASWSFEADHKLNIEGATFDVGWPRSYFVTWLLAEEDWGGFGTFVNEMYQQVKAEVEAKIEDSASDLTTLLVAEGIGATVGAVLGNVIGAVVGAVAGLLIVWFVGLAEDDIFTPITVSVDIDSPYSPFGADDRTNTRQVWWKGHGGHYKLRYHWEVYDAVPVLEMLEANALAATRWNMSRRDADQRSPLSRGAKTRHYPSGPLCPWRRPWRVPKHAADFGVDTVAHGHRFGNVSFRSGELLMGAWTTRDLCPGRRRPAVAELVERKSLVGLHQSLRRGAVLERTGGHLPSEELGGRRCHRAGPTHVAPVGDRRALARPSTRYSRRNVSVRTVFGGGGATG